MPYAQQSWLDGSSGGTPVTAARLDHMEAGIAAAAGSSSLTAAVVGSEVDVTVTSNWGIDPSGNAYYNSAGADPADAAIATLGADGHILLTDTRGGVVAVPVASVNGRTGVVTGLAEQVDLDALASSTTTALAGKASTAYATSRAVAMALVLGS